MIHFTLQELVQLTWCFSRSFSMPYASFSMLYGPGGTGQHWKWCTWHQEASAKNSSKLNKFLHSEVNILIQHKIRERKVKTLTKNWRYHRRTSTHKLNWNISTITSVFINQKRMNVCEWTHDKDDIIFVMCSLTFTLFWLRNTTVTVKVFWLSFHVFTCICPTVITSIFGKSFEFPFPYFVLFILW